MTFEKLNEAVEDKDALFLIRTVVLPIGFAFQINVMRKEMLEDKSKQVRATRASILAHGELWNIFFQTKMKDDPDVQRGMIQIVKSLMVRNETEGAPDLGLDEFSEDTQKAQKLIEKINARIEESRKIITEAWPEEAAYVKLFMQDEEDMRTFLTILGVNFQNGDILDAIPMNKEIGRKVTIGRNPGLLGLMLNDPSGMDIAQILDEIPPELLKDLLVSIFKKRL